MTNKALNRGKLKRGIQDKHFRYDTIHLTSSGSSIKVKDTRLDTLAADYVNLKEASPKIVKELHKITKAINQICEETSLMF